MAAHSKKSREKFADTLMTMSGALGVAVTVATLVAPIGLILKQIVSGRKLDVLRALSSVDPGLWGLLIVFYSAGVALVVMGRKSAFKIYDELYPDS